MLASVAAILVAGDDPRKAPAAPVDAHQREAAEVAEALRESWPDHPEWVDMLTGILEDEPMGPNFVTGSVHGQDGRPALTGTRRDGASTGTATVA